ncbi:MAG: endonuclease, partial [Paracoccaceae bacterium]|nr:endonuclease [Paracoccaceae bacterium]
MANVLPDPTSQRLRIATYNVEWFNALFDNDGQLVADFAPSARYGVTRAEQLGALGIVFTAMDADAILVIEAPDTNGKRSTVRALETFARHFDLRTRRAIIGYTSDTEQEIALLYDPDRMTVRHDPQGAPPGRGRAEAVPRFDGVFRVDLDQDTRSERIRFSKPPLELAVKAGDLRFRMIGVHAKSKAPHGVRGAAELLRVGIENRRKQLAQCLWLRARIKVHLAAGDSLIVLGDFNDGPGLDAHERQFGQSGVEIVLGQDGPPESRLFDPHAQMALGQKVGVTPTTARFYLASQRRFFEALLD